MKKQFLLCLLLLTALLAQGADSTATSKTTDTVDTVATTTATLNDTTAVKKDSTEIAEKVSADTSVKNEENTPDFGLRVTSTPDSVQVVIGGKTLGITPLLITDIAAGSHTLLLKKKGYYAKKVTAKVAPKTVTDIEVELRAPAKLTVITTPDSASILLNKKMQGKTPITLTPLRPGDYSLLLLKSGFDRIEQSVTVESGADDTLKIDLTAVVSENAEDASEKDTTKSALEEKPTEKADSDKKGKKIVTAIAGSVFALFITLMMVFEFSGNRE